MAMLIAFIFIFGPILVFLGFGIAYAHTLWLLLFGDPDA